MRVTTEQVNGAVRAKHPGSIKDGCVDAKWLDRFVFTHLSLEDRAAGLTLEDKQLHIRADKARYEIDQAWHDRIFWESMNRQMARQREVRDEQGIPYGNPNFGRIRVEDIR